MQIPIAIDLMMIYEILRPLAFNILGITAYGVFIFNFYRFMARKDIVKLNLQKHNHAKHPALRKSISVIFYTFKCLMLYPVFVFFWFCVMAGLLYLLGRNQSTESVMLVAMGVVGAIRVCSYYKEALATDISKILPFALLGILIVDNSLVRIVDSAAGVREAALLWETLAFYLVAVVLVEFVLRMATGIFGLIRNRVKSHKQDEQTEAEPVQETPVAAEHDSQPSVAEPVWSSPQPAPASHFGGVPSENPDTPVWNDRDRLRLERSVRRFPKVLHQPVGDSSQS